MTAMPRRASMPVTRRGPVADEWSDGAMESISRMMFGGYNTCKNKFSPREKGPGLIGAIFECS
jgi:hypothetical protein